MAETENPTTKTAEKDIKSPATPGALLGAMSGGALVPGGVTGSLPVRVRAGGITLDAGTEVTDQLDASVPAFGNVLRSIGDGLAISQKALDKGVIDTVNALNNTKIKVVTDVVEVLGDDGLPDVTQTSLVTNEVSVLNFFTPTVHEWKNMSVAMDLSIGSFHQEQGLQFNQVQHRGGTTGTGLFWGFLGWFDTDNATTETSVTTHRTNDVSWQTGQIRVDALLGPRNTGKLPVPASVAVGPQIFVSQGAVQDQKTGDTITARTLDLQIEVRKADGSPNPAKNVTLASGGLLPSFPAGSATDANGQLKVTLTRTLVPGFTTPLSFQLSVSLGQLRKPFTVTL